LDVPCSRSAFELEDALDTHGILASNRSAACAS
jgi:hypothetical protein